MRVGAGVLERVVTGLEPGTTYACVLASENGKGGYSSPVSPITTSGAPYRTDEAIFFAHYDLLNTLPTYPDPVDASTMSCVAIVDPVTHPGSTEVGTDGAPTEAAPALWYQLSWDGARPNAAARNTLVGTAAWLAPEVAVGSNARLAVAAGFQPGVGYGKKADVRH